MFRWRQPLQQIAARKTAFSAQRIQKRQGWRFWMETIWHADDLRSPADSHRTTLHDAVADYGAHQRRVMHRCQVLADRVMP